VGGGVTGESALRLGPKNVSKIWSTEELGGAEPSAHAAPQFPQNFSSPLKSAPQDLQFAILN